MGRKRTRTGKYFHLCVASLILLSLTGCATLERTKEGVYISSTSIEKRDGMEFGSPLREKTKDVSEADEYLTRSMTLFSRGDFEGALRENQKALSLSGNQPPGDEALFNMALIHAYSGNPKKDYGKSLRILKRLIKDYPQGVPAERAKVWVEILQEHEKLSQSVEELTRVIEKSKQVDIEIEEKKREKAK